MIGTWSRRRPSLTRPVPYAMGWAGRSPDVRGGGVVEQVLFHRVAVEPADRAQPARDGGPSPAARFQVAGVALDVCPLRGEPRRHALAPKDFTPEMLKPLGSGEYQWNPERSTSGPITMLVSAADRTLYVYRNGEPIGRASIEVKGRLGGHVFTLLEGVSSETSPLAPGRPARKWMSVQSDAASRSADVAALAKRVRISPEFAGKVYDTLTPGATIIVTDQPAVRKASRDFTILAD